MNWILDTKNLGERDGFDLRVEVTPDQGPTPADYDCYDEAATEAWHVGAWEYVHVEVIASKRGYDLGRAFIGGVERGWFPRVGGGDQWVDPLSDEVINDYTDDLIEEALQEAKAELTALIAS